ncbi:MAG: ATP-dependent DNA helicase RecG [Acidobacteria bacterium]|nr:ATP-dependent DNA helicase RecG [Acidobacteriota bacterium]
MHADTELRYLKGVGPRRAEKLAAVGYETVEDLLYVLPFRYEDRRSFASVTDLAAGGLRTIEVVVVSARLIRTRRRNFTIFEADVEDATGQVRAVWYNRRYLAQAFAPGRRVVLFGKTTLKRGRTVLENPDYEFLDEEDAEGIHTGRIVPVYRKLADLTPRVLRQLLHRALSGLEPETLGLRVPPEIAERHGLMPRIEALRGVHFPDPEVDLERLREGRTDAHRTLAFEEIFLLQLALAMRRHGFRKKERGIAYEVTDALRTKLARMLPFKLTAAQKRVLKEIGEDLRSAHPMNRLLQGDVGSGKTVVALLALLVAIENGYQGALMAPTEILADQHFRSLQAMLDAGSIDCPMVLLTGSLRAAHRREVEGKIASGWAKLIIGTHALFETRAEFRKLGLCVIDEQHRFGVLQRARLADRGQHPDVLVMTATPIPRSLALTLYGDLDVSVIDELPPGRTPIKTVLRRERDRKKVYEGIRVEAGRGHQAYVVVPLVEETAKSDLKAATAFAEQLAGELAPLSVDMVHGRMKPTDKDSVMQRFVAGELDVLVATTVIEVGVDVPNASVMIVEHAERFGLSQLHQLRGRVGRGAARSYCVLMVGKEITSKEADERLGVMVETNDGFRIAERDLALRGPGVVFGTQQHGLSDLKFLAEVIRQPALLEAARDEAIALVGEPAGRSAAEAILTDLPGPWRDRLELGRVG